MNTSAGSHPRPVADPRHCLSLPPSRGQQWAEAVMEEALAVARTTPRLDIPVGAVIIDPLGRIIGTGTNRREVDGDPTAHAEIVALREAARNHGDGWHLDGCSLIVTLEPCAMCTGALLAARIDSVVFGAYEPKTGACGSLYDLPLDPLSPHHPQLYGGIREEECLELLTAFFRRLRDQSPPP